MIKSIAVFGVNGIHGSVIAEKLAQCSFRILLVSEMQCDYSKIYLNCPDSDIQVVDCPIQAAWESDIILMDVLAGHKLKLIESIREFVTKKIVLNIVDFNRAGTLKDEINVESLLPYGRLVNLSFIRGGEEQSHFSVSGSDKDALEEVEALLELAGFKCAAVE